jgi:hypothetical protein
MALINAVTPADKRAFIYCIEDRESRWLSFASANQVLSGMIKNLPNNPKLIKTLDVDSAVEAIGWIDSPELLESITASDPRTGVADAVKSQMRKVASCVPTSVPNQHNIEERTRRLLSKHVSQWAELLTETEVSFKMVHDAVVELTDSDFELLATGVLPHSGLHESVGGFTARLASVLVKEGSNSPLLAHTLANSRACHNVMSAWDGNWNKAFGLMADRVFERNDTPHYLLRLKNDRLRNFSIDAECLDVWIAKGRLDFLCLTGEVTDDVVQDLVEKTSSLSDLVMALNLAAKPSYVDIMVEKMVALGGLDRSDSRASYWRRSISVSLFNSQSLTKRETVRNICALLEPRNIADALSDSTSAVILGSDDIDFVASALGYKFSSDALFHMSRSSKATEHQTMFLEAVTALPGSSRLAKNRYRYASSDWIFSSLAARLVETFGSNTSAWDSFWTVYDQTSEASFDELVELALTLS